MDPQERHYNIKKLNVIFAITSVALLSSILWLFIDDYKREWKEYQTEFKTLEIEKSRVKLDKESLELTNHAEYQELLKELDAEEQRVAVKCSDKNLEKSIADLQTKDNIAQQQYKFNKAELDASRYRFEEASAHHAKNTAVAKDELIALTDTNRKLELAAEQSATALNQKLKLQDECKQNLNDLEKKRRNLVGKSDVIQRKLTNIDPANMSFANQIAGMIRDLPIIDLANPTLRIDDKQVVLADIRDDVNFMTVPKVERCIACHLGITNPDYENADQPFKTHPNLDLYVGNNSSHPIEEFGCTVCHGGRARGTSFYSTSHIPSSPDQKKRWQENYDWHPNHLWDEPMFPLTYVEAGCFKCHSGESVIKGAERLSTGLNLIEKAGCYGCHNIEKYKNWPKPGPDLTKISSKFSKDWAYKWIKDPQSFRHNTWMPTFFNQSNNSDALTLKRTDQEIHTMVHFLYDKSEEFTLNKTKGKGDPVQGEELVASLGCLACHQTSVDQTNEKTTREDIRRQQGPTLTALGSKTSKEWIFNWLKDPSRYHPETRMPSLRLTDKEASHITAYLVQNKNEGFDQIQVPPLQEEIINTIVFDLLTKIDTHKQATEKISKMELHDKLLFAGEKLIQHYGCYGCHKIAGFENVKPIGAELTEEGDKSTHNLDFGFIHIEHTNFAWFDQKLRDPRIFDNGKIKAHDAKLIMPNYHLSNDEIDSIVTAILGFVNTDRVKRKIKPRTGRNMIIERGQEIVRQFNCTGCHIIEDDGGSIKPTINTWLTEYEKHPQDDADKFTDSYSPPNLYGLGKKVNPQWLFEFLHQPNTKIRTWLKVRMPTFNFNTAHLNALVKYFNTLDNAEFPFQDIVDVSLSASEYKSAEKLFSKDYFDCQKCHVVGGQLPSGSPETWAPDLAKSKEKLRPQWMIEWIKNPTALMPGTKMPTFFDPDDFENSGPPDIFNGDENTQIRFLRNFLLSLSEKPPKVSKKTVETQAPPQEQSQEQATDSPAQ